MARPNRKKRPHGSTNQPFCRRRIASGLPFSARRKFRNGDAVPRRTAAVLLPQALEPDRVAGPGLWRGRHLDSGGDSTRANAPAIGTAMDHCRHYPGIGRAVHLAGRAAAEFPRDQGALPGLVRLAWPAERSRRDRSDGGRERIGIVLPGRGWPRSQRDPLVQSGNVFALLVGKVRRQPPHLGIRQFLGHRAVVLHGPQLVGVRIFQRIVGFDHVIEAYNALKYAHANELRAMQYYRSVAEESTDPEVRRLAADFADEESEHVAALDQWIALTSRPSSTWQDDPDPLPPAV